MKRLYTQERQYALGAGSECVKTVGGRTIDAGTPGFIVPYFLEPLPDLNIPSGCRKVSSGFEGGQRERPAPESPEQALTDAHDLWRSTMSEADRSELASAAMHWTHVLLETVSTQPNRKPHLGSEGNAGKRERRSNEQCYLVGHWASYLAEHGVEQTDETLEYVGTLACGGVMPAHVDGSVRSHNQHIGVDTPGVAQATESADPAAA